MTCHCPAPSSTIRETLRISAICTSLWTRYEEDPRPYPIFFQNSTVQNLRSINIKKSINSLSILMKKQVFWKELWDIYLIILRNSLISSMSLSAISSFLELDFSITQSISSLIAWPRAERTAESCWIISRTHDSSSIIWMTPRSCPSIRRSLLVTRFFWSMSFIFTVL